MSIASCDLTTALQGRHDRKSHSRVTEEKTFSKAVMP